MLWQQTHGRQWRRRCLPTKRLFSSYGKDYLPNWKFGNLSLKVIVKSVRRYCSARSQNFPVGTNSPLLYKRRLKFGDFVACKADVFCRANDLDVETDREIRRVSKMIPRGRLTVQNNGVGGEEKIRERFLPAPPFLVFQLISWRLLRSK